MADEIQDDRTEMFVKPALMALKVIGRFFDVATFMLRLLMNTVIYDTPHGKVEATEGRARD
jgi:hypothetical protein